MENYNLNEWRLRDKLKVVILTKLKGQKRRTPDVSTLYINSFTQRES